MVAELQVEQKAKVEELVGNGAGHETVFVDQFVDGILDPNRPMLGPVRDGGARLGIVMLRTTSRPADPATES